MPRFAIYRDGNFAEEREFAEKPVLPNKPQLAFYLVEIVRPAFDPVTQVSEGPVIEEDHALQIRRYVWTTRDKTALELDAEKERTIDRMGVVALKLIFNHENRIRTLEGRAQVTAEQFRQAVKAML